MLPITFLSDYGYRDEFVGVCHGVIERIAPGATVVDLTHGVPPHDVRAGALALRNALPYLPKAVHLAVVDPKVGTQRRPLAVRCYDGHQFVGPDNGLLWPAIKGSGGIEMAVDVTHSPYRLEPVSATFHGRDLFAPVAARLALESPLEGAGRPVPPDDVARLEFPRPKVGRGKISGQALAVDRFGNLQLNVGAEDMRAAGFSPGDALRVQVGESGRLAIFAHTFADAPPGEAVLYEDSSRGIAVALNGGSAAEALGAAPSDAVELTSWNG
jgi:S-adenosyl-L-methionine hydrolase (adenosine-forming)